jgi:hypothetical protein
LAGVLSSPMLYWFCATLIANSHSMTLQESDRYPRKNRHDDQPGQQRQQNARCRRNADVNWNDLRLSV